MRNKREFEQIFCLNLDLLQRQSMSSGNGTTHPKERCSKLLRSSCGNLEESYCRDPKVKRHKSERLTGFMEEP